MSEDPRGGGGEQPAGVPFPGDRLIEVSVQGAAVAADSWQLCGGPSAVRRRREGAGTQAPPGVG